MAGLLPDAGRDNAQIIALLVPLEEMLVKKPGSCPPPIEADWATRLSEVVGEVCSFHTSTVDPPLLTTRATESSGSTK